MAPTAVLRRNGANPFEALTSFCQFWQDSKVIPCCQFASDEELSGDGEQYDCQTCVVAARVEELDSENSEAWRLFGRLVSRLTMDVPGLVTPILERIVSDLDRDDALDLLQRLSVIYDTVIPPKPTV